MNTLQDYITDTQRLLHDSSNQFWSQQELTDYVNKARKLVAAQTGCSRQLATLDITASTTQAEATYSLDTDIITTPVVRRVTDVLDVILNYSANTTFQLRYYPFSTMIRTGIWQVKYAGTPVAYTINNRDMIILQWPAIDYLGSVVDCLVEPISLTSLSDADADISFPYTECVGFYAAHLAKLKDQRRSEAEDFYKDFQRRIISAIGTEFTRRIVGK